MAKQTVVTDEGLRRLEKELEELKTVKRKEIAEKIKVALSFGDLSSENSEYDEAKNEQAIIEGRIAEIESQLKNVRVLDENELTNETVHIGSTVRMKDTGTGEELTYRIVGSTESDPLEGEKFPTSRRWERPYPPSCGRGRRWETPGGIMNLEIVEISR